MRLLLCVHWMLAELVEMRSAKLLVCTEMSNNYSTSKQTNNLNKAKQKNKTNIFLEGNKTEKFYKAISHT